MDNGLTDLSSIYLPRFVSQIVPWGGGQVAVVLSKAGERGGGAGGQNTWGPDWFGGPKS